MQNSQTQPYRAELAPTDAFLQELDSYWINDAGLRQGTRKRYLPTIRRFLSTHFPTGDIDWNLLTTTSVAGFVTTELERHRNRATQSMVCTSIRSLLRYVRLKAPISDGMELILPQLPRWRQAHIPQRLSGDQLTTLLAACSGDQAGDVRRKCLLLLCSRLGMRTAEIAALSIDDIDWIHGCVLIKGGKNRRDRCLPLPADVGDALVAHLRAPRPAAAPRGIFLASRPPYSANQNYARIRAEIRKLLQKAGISGVRQGAHVLRHTAATVMVNRGATFKEVADVLGHKSLQTTTIYAKLDLASLAEVALPWYGGGR